MAGWVVPYGGSGTNPVSARDLRDGCLGLPGLLGMLLGVLGCVGELR
jgi:hypothetical protein